MILSLYDNHQRKKYYLVKKVLSRKLLILVFLLFSQQYLMQEMSDLPQILRSILRKNSSLAELAEDETVFSDIMGILNGNQSGNDYALTTYLSQQCNISYKDILLLISELINNSTTLTIFGEKILKIWILIKVYELMEAWKNNPEAKIKRMKVEEVFRKHEFQESKLVFLLGKSFQSIHEPLSQKDLKELSQQMIMGKEQLINKLFVKKQMKTVTKKDSKIEERQKINQNTKIISSYNADKTVKAQFDDLIADYRVFPVKSFEKMLQNEIICAFALKNNLELDQEFTQRSDLNNLRTAYLEQFKFVPNDVKTIFDNIGKSDKQNLYTNLFALKKNISSINVLELQRLINKTNQAKQLIEGKDIIFIIGNTGSGKSTNILKLLGYTLKVDKYNGLETLVPVEQLEDDHKTFHTSPIPVSCTRYINGVVVPHKMYPFGVSQYKKILVLCDSPGFGDTAGFEVDIANGVGMINALYGVNSVRVVLILPYNSLLGDRMDGAIKMGVTISNLFREMTVLKRVQVYFNKVPQDKIDETSILIKTKLQKLSEVEKSNSKLVDFMTQLSECAKRRQNFINPLKDDYKIHFEKLFNMKPIEQQQVKRCFQYEFTSDTKKEIEKFIQAEHIKVKDYFAAKKFQNAQFHMKMLEILKNILTNNDRLKTCFCDLVRYVQEQSTKIFTYLEELITEIINCRNNSSTEKKLQYFKENIILIHDLFHQFEKIQLVSREKIDELIDQKKKALLEQFGDLSGLNEQTITAVKTFSKILAPSLEQQAASMIDKNFSSTYQEVERLAKDKNYLQINDKVQSLSILYKYIIQLSHPISSKSAAFKMEGLKKMLEEEVEEGFKTITQIINESPRLKANMINEANAKIENIKQIESLKFLEKGQEIKQRLNSLLKQIEGICKKTVRELDNVRLTLNEEVQSNGNIEENQLSSKKKAIEFLMKIDCIGENLKEDYEHAIGNISRKLKENVEILRNGIAALKGNKTEEIYRNLQNIKKATAIVLRCSKIVDKGEESNELAISIQSEFMTFLNGEIEIIKNFEVRLAKISQESYFDKILDQCRKIETYAKMGIIGNEIKKAVDDIRKQFKAKVNIPLKEFLERQVINIQEKKSYKFLTYSLDKLQKLSSYLFQTEDNLPLQYRSQIKDSEALLVNKLHPFFQSMQRDVKDFIHTQFDVTSRPPSLKELIKILLAVNAKKKTCQFLSIRIDFNIEDHISNIEKKLKQFMEHLEASFNSHTKAAQLQAINECCKYYSEIEEYYKQSKFGFKELQKRCSIAFTQSLKNDEDRIKVLIRDISPTKIAFQYLQTYYQQFRALRSPQGGKKRRFIVDELKIVEKNCKSELEKFKKEMDDPNFINKDDFLKAFQEANVLVKQLNELYTEEEDKKSILIQKQDIRKIGIKIFNLFESKYEIVYLQISDLDFNNLHDNIKSFGSLESMIYDAFPLETMIEQSSQQLITNGDATNDKKDEEKLLVFVLERVNFLRQLIETHEFLKDQKLNAKNTKKLKNLLDYLRKGALNMVNHKYHPSVISNMIVDAGFLRYFNNCNKQQKTELIGFVNQKMEMLFQQYKQKLNQSGDVAQSFSKGVVENCFNFLPPQISSIHIKQFNKLKKQLINNNYAELEKTSKLFSANPANSNIFFNQSKASLMKNQKGIHEKYVNALQEFFDQSNFSSKVCQEKIQFLNNYILKVFQNNEKYFRDDEKMLIVLMKFFYQFIKVLIEEGAESIKVIKEFIQNSQKQQKQNFFQQEITKIFKIYVFVFSIKDNFFGDLTKIKNIQDKAYQSDILLDFKQFKEKFTAIYQKPLVQISKRFFAGVDKRPSQKLNSTEIIDPKKMKTVQIFIRYLKTGGHIVDRLEKQLENTYQKLQLVHPKTGQFKKTQYNKILVEYEDQMKTMFKFCQGFQFQSAKKRNMTAKELQEDLSLLNMYYRILNERKAFFKQYVIRQDLQSFDFEGIPRKIRQKFERLHKLSKDQVQEAFKNYNGEPVTKINLFVSQLQIISNKEFKFIEAELVKNVLEDLKSLLKNQFEAIKIRSMERFEGLKKKFDEVAEKLKILDHQQKGSIQKEKKNFEQVLAEKSYQIEKKYNELISIESCEAKKIQLKNAKKVEIHSLKKDVNDNKNKIIQQLQQKYVVERKKLNESLLPQIDSYTTIIKVAKKTTIEITCESRVDIVDNLLAAIQKLKPKQIGMIQNSFENDQHDEFSIGKKILTSSKVFSSYQVKMINELIKGQDINYVINYLQRITLNGREKMTQGELNEIKSRFVEFKKHYDELKSRYEKNPSQTTINYIVEPLKTLGKQIKQSFYFKSKPQKIPYTKIRLLAGIFALWAILKAQVNDGCVEFTIEPHPAQITALILLLGISQPNEQLGDRLAQVGTGQGKSIVLAGLSCYLALVGFKVRCACYSAYLSGRDQESFKMLFSKLNVQNEIKYGTFHQLCEDILNSGGSNLKESVQNMLLQPPKGILQSIASAFGANFVKLNKGANQIQDNPTILVIDEVDVFFDNSFFGKNYCPGIILKDPTVNAMLQLVWKEVSQKQKDIEIDSLFESQQFKNLIDRYPTLKDLLKNQVHGMVAGALNCNHPYVIINQKIGYKDSDSISFKINYGYKTVFANLLEYQRGKISRQSLDEAMQICLMIAEFSYAKLPEFFKNILGVTGTLEVLPRYKKEQLITRYKITDQFAIPSAFGINKRRIEDYTLTSKESFYQEIINKINQIQHNRPIIIFFKGPRELNEFYVHPLFEPYQARANSLTEEHDPFTRDSRITKAVDPKNITLMTNSFGRGTDFVLLDKAIKQNGGLHVIQAFISLDESEQVQIKGRTARQSGKGSYDCVLDESWLEQLELKSEDMPKNATSEGIHTILFKARQSKIQKEAQSTLNTLKQSDKMHDKTISIFTTPKLAQSDLIEYVSGLNKYPEIRKTVIKTVLGLDATGSMSAALKRTCEIIGNAFTETYAVLNKQNVKATIQIKIIVYRNYNSPKEEILQSTTFENTPVNLKSFLERVKPKGGWGNEALQVLFQSLNKEKKIDQVILIGDAAPNSESDVQYKRKERGTDYWTRQGFPATHIDKEIAEFTSKDCPVHSFYLNDGKGFNDISSKTKGQAAPFKINAPDVTKQLSSFVVTNILRLVEKNSGNTGVSLVQTYRQMFP